MVSISANSDIKAYGVKHFLADTLTDITGIDISTASVGSTCFVIDSSETYMLNHARQWKKIKRTSTGGDSGEGDISATYIYDGGVEI